MQVRPGASWRRYVCSPWTPSRRACSWTRRGSTRVRAEVPAGQGCCTPAQHFHACTCASTTHTPALHLQGLCTVARQWLLHSYLACPCLHIDKHDTQLTLPCRDCALWQDDSGRGGRVRPVEGCDALCHAPHPEVRPAHGHQCHLPGSPAGPGRSCSARAALHLLHMTLDTLSSLCMAATGRPPHRGQEAAGWLLRWHHGGPRHRDPL